MHKFVKTAIAAAALIGAFLGGQHYAHAATPASTVPAQAQFGGIYLGVDANALNIDNTANSTDTKFDFGGDGRIGYNYQTSQGYVIGGEVSDGTNAGVTRNPGYKQTVGNDFAADIRGGKVVSDTLLYGKVGYAATQVTTENQLDGSSNSGAFNGVRFGLGAEHHLTEKLIGRVEGVYTNYQARTFDSVQVDPSNVAAKIGVSYKID